MRAVKTISGNKAEFLGGKNSLMLSVEIMMERLPCVVGECHPTR